MITQTSPTPSSSGRTMLRANTRQASILLTLSVTAALLGVAAPATGAASAPRPTSAPLRAAAAPPAAPAAIYAANEIVVGYSPSPSPEYTTNKIDTASASNPREREPASANTRLLRVAPGVSVATALRSERAERGVEWAVPDYIAHAAGGLIPDDEGTGHEPGDWAKLQWNFAGTFGVQAPEAWANVAADGAPGGKGVIVAVLDTGVAYANRGPFRRSPDFSGYTFVKGWDFVAKDPYPNDRNGHGTFVAATIAEETNNHYGLTGLAFAARIMPVRVLNSQGEGEASTIAEGVMFAVRHHAQVINMSLEFTPGVTAADIPELMQALRYAHRHDVLVVAAAGNEGSRSIDYPARAPNVVAVGASTEHGCLADYSNFGLGLTLVAPGGGADADLPGDPNCRPEGPPGADVYQVTFTGSSYTRFGIPSGYEGTSMATPHVAATAALIIASGVLGRHPTPAQITARLKATARKLGGGGDERLYGAGLVDAAAATARAGAVAPAPTPVPAPAPVAPAPTG
jgi:serine protease